MLKKGLFIVIFLWFLPVFGQKKPKPFKVKDANKELIAAYRDTFERKKEVVFKNNRYRVYNNYINVGAGKAYNTGWNNWDLATAVDFNFHLRKLAFQTGAVLTGPELFNNDNVELHLCWGYRVERYQYQWALYGGISYNNGVYLVTKDTITELHHLYQPGIYVAGQFFYKVKFDYGIGFTAFTDINAVQKLYGIRLEVFFSSAYRGVKHHNYAKEEEQRSPD